MNISKPIPLVPYTGIARFLRGDIKEERTDFKSDIVFVGVPYDGGTSNRPGARYGPQALRAASMLYCYGEKGRKFQGIYDVDKGKKVLEGVSIADTGDIETFSNNQNLTLELIMEEMGKVYKASKVAVIAGGDHSISYGSISQLGEECDVIHFDAHTDYMDPDNDSYCAHGTVMNKVSQLAHVRRIVHCGIRGLLNSEYSVGKAVENGDVVVTAEEVHKKGTGIIQEYLTKDVPYYVTFDVDVLDPSIAPGTGTPEPGGFSYRQMREMLSIVGRTHKLRAIDVVEVNPLFDQTTNTAQHAVRLLIDLLGEHFDT